MSKLNTFVHVHDKDGIAHAFGPDDTVPEWAENAITNPGVWAEAPAEEDPDEPEGSDPEGSEPETVELPEGDVTEDWTVKQLKAYAKAENFDLGDAKNKAEILAKLAE
jgi:hypothetical protein